ncbi:pleckstrin homology domain-containing family D member 1-like isoform X2 [Lytechinus variegatus]|uniref:pleckstrin homology domain-containing family D member 1-like isoform X2 n=1 Tax=Lytechinus variegatus TaxID=7654 RepID=UPI001BB270B2|nr:pleckstrin homology domain-containing family D member 1-like isoform X2 [Lytechinus variegatus]
MCDIFGGDTLPSKVQRWGVLWKKPFSQNGSTKWAKRFFIIKEGFLLYYSENEKRDFERKRHFNMHPKGVIPLGGAIIEMVNDPTKMCAFRIVHDDLNGSIYLATDTEYDREKWVDIMRKSGRITWKNAELGESMIQTLEKQSLELARDSQRYREQLHLEALALRDEMDKNEELEKIAIELEEEKMKIENTARELLDEHERTKMELEETMNAMQQVASEKEQLSQASESYLEGIKALAQEREQKELELQRRESEMQQLSSVNKTLVSETNALKDNLKDIENKTNLLENELCVIEDRLKEKEVQAEILEEEKRSFNLQARELESSLHDLTVQKELTDAELKEEIIARRDAERRLKKAEDSLSRLESALKEEKSMERPEPRTERQSQLDVEIFTNVAHLKRFFEDIAAEAQLDSNKPIIMKNAIHARKSLVRKTKSFKFRKERDRNHARHSFASFRVADSQKLSSLSSMRHSVAIGNQINDHFVLDLNTRDGDDSSSDPSRRSLDFDDLTMLSATKGGLTSPPHTLKTRGTKQSYDSTGSGGGADDESSSVSSSTTDGLNSPIPGEADDLHVAFEQKI